MKKKLCLEYQLYTECNLGCDYCYNYFDQGIHSCDYYVPRVKKLLELYHDETCFILNGGEPLLFKDFDRLVNLATETANTYTYTNGTLSTIHYKKFLQKLLHKDKLYFTISLHYKEILKNNKLPERLLKNIDLFAKQLPNFKLNVIVTEDFKGEFLEVVRQAMRDVKEQTAVQNVNMLIVDHVYEDEIGLIRLLDQKFIDFVEELDNNFTYKNCLWDNTRKTLTEMVKDIKTNAALKLAGKDFSIPYEYEFTQLNFLESAKGMIVENRLSENFKEHVVPFDEFDKFIDDIKPLVQSKPLRKIKSLMQVGII